MKWSLQWNILGQTATSRWGFPTFQGLVLSPWSVEKPSHLDSAICPRKFRWIYKGMDLGITAQNLNCMAFFVGKFPGWSCEFIVTYEQLHTWKCLSNWKKQQQADLSAIDVFLNLWTINEPTSLRCCKLFKHSLFSHILTGQATFVTTLRANTCILTAQLFQNYQINPQ